MKIFRGLLLFTLILLATAAGCVLLFPVVLTLPLHSKRIIRFRHLYISLICAQYYQFIALLYCHISGTKIRLYTNKNSSLSSSSSSSSLILCNHRSRIDWVFAGWIFSTMINTNGHLKFVLKDSLKSIPLFGWAMQTMLYIFLSRSRTRGKDIPHIDTVSSYLQAANKRICLFIFPEGTDLSESNKMRSQQFAKDRNLPLYQYVLHPKPSGFVTCIESLCRGNGSSNFNNDNNNNNGIMVIDLTIAYVDFSPNIRSSEKSLLFGSFPQEVHLFMNATPIHDLPLDARGRHQVIYYYHSSNNMIDCNLSVYLLYLVASAELCSQGGPVAAFL